MSEPRTSRIVRPGLREAVVPHVAALSPLSSSGSKSDDRPAASSPEPADMSRRLWPHPGRVRSTRAAILTTDRLAATTAAATAAQRREPRSLDFAFASSLLPFNGNREGPPSSVPGGPFVFDRWLELLWLFHRFSGLHIHSAPCLTSRLASVAPPFTSHLASFAAPFTSLVATGAPRLTPVHAGRSCGWCWGGWRWSGWRWSGWLGLSISI